jgi:hypothetical protein
MYTSKFDVRTGATRYTEGQVYQTDGPQWYLLRDGVEVPIRWNWWLDHPLHSEGVKKLLTQALAWGWLDLANPESEQKFTQIMDWAKSQD